MIIYNEEVAKCPLHKMTMTFLKNTENYNDEYNTKYWECDGKGKNHIMMTQEWNDTVYYLYIPVL